MTAKIKLNAASGGGSISIQAPSSSSNNRVIALPDIADGTLVTSESTLDATKLSGALPAISGANLTGISAGITEADVWRLTQNVQGSQGSLSTLTSWERADDVVAAYVGTGMSHSSGYFTFPSTGKWLIQVQLTLYGQYAFGYGYIMTAFKSSGSGSYDGMARAYGNVSASNGYSGGFSQCLVDVTESGGSGAAAYFDQKTESTSGRFIGGSSSQNYTSIAFIRLGDT